MFGVKMAVILTIYQTIYVYMYHIRNTKTPDLSLKMIPLKTKIEPLSQTQLDVNFPNFQFAQTH